MLQREFDYSLLEVPGNEYAEYRAKSEGFRIPLNIFGALEHLWAGQKSQQASFIE